MLRVGLTGGIGSGKSTVSAQLAALGAVVVDADAVAREVVEPGTPALAAVADRFGAAVLDRDGGLDRPALGRVVFGDPAALRDLEALTHPAIWARTAQIIDDAGPDASSCTTCRCSSRRGWGPTTTWSSSWGRPRRFGSGASWTSAG